MQISDFVKMIECWQWMVLLNAQIANKRIYIFKSYPLDDKELLESDGHGVKTWYKRPVSYSRDDLEWDSHIVNIGYKNRIFIAIV